MSQDLSLRAKKIPVPAKVWEIIAKRTSNALEMLNSNYKTDGGRDVHDYYKGYLMALVNLKAELEPDQEEESSEDVAGESDTAKMLL
jgi:hypothetical protein